MAITWRSTDIELDKVERDRVETAAQFMKLESPFAIDSYNVGPDGPFLASIFLVQGDLIAEVHLTHDYLEFDSAHNKRLLNHRVILNKKVPIKADAVVVSAAADKEPAGATEAAPITTHLMTQVQLVYEERITAHLSYFGKDAEAWLSTVLQLIPSKVVSLY